MKKDPIVDAVDRASQKLLKRYGGIHGLIEHLQALDRESLAERTRRRSRSRAKVTTNENGSQKRHAAALATSHRRSSA